MDERHEGFAQIGVLRVARDADDLIERTRLPDRLVDLEDLPDRIPRAEVLAHEGLGHDPDLG